MGRIREAPGYTQGRLQAIRRVSPRPDHPDLLIDVAAQFTAGARADSVYVPDRNGTRFLVVLVRRKGRGTALDHKEVLLQRVPGTNVNWPTNDL